MIHTKNKRKQMKPYVHYFSIVLFFFPLWISAQVFPVQANPQVIPPYSLKLSEYGTASSEKLILNLLLTDITEANRQVQLKLFIENNAGLSIRSSDVVMGANPIFLDGGVPLRLSNLDLQPYFSLQNLTGIAPQQYSTPLPEGLYRFCFEVYDALSGQQISRKSCVPVYLVLNDPPFLNLPFRGEQVLMREPQNIVFQWTPRHLNATNVSYEFTLTELWDNQMDPQASFLAGRPLYQTTTFSTTLLYGPGETQLLPDKKYGWRVRAIVSDGISETSVFKNDGYSEVYHFTYTGSCAEPEAILAEAKNNTTEKIYWQGVDHKLYDVQYKKKGSDGIWFNAGTLNETTTIYNLEPGTTYEFRVGGQCIDDGPYTYSQVYEFTTTLSSDSETTYNCGITPEIVITNQEPLQNLVINETFTAGDFPVTVKEVTGGNATYVSTIPEDQETNENEGRDEDETSLPDENATGDGTFSGWGYIVVPYLNDTRIKVSFDNIKINTDYQLVEGIVETDYDKNWGGLASVNDILDVFEGDNDVRTINLDYDITIENIRIGEDGTTIEIAHPISNAIREEPGGDDVTIIDRSGDIFHVDADGNIREGGQMAPGGPISAQNTIGVNNKGEVTELTAQGVRVDFLEYTDYAYGFDGMPSGQEKALEKYYKQIKDTDGKLYNIINKSVGNGDTDIIRAKVTITDPNVSINDLVIKTIHGENVSYTLEGDGIINLELKGHYSFEHENIYATLQPKNNGEKQKIAGVFSQWHLANKNVNVTFIPVNGAALPRAEVLGSQINNIFKQASVTFNVTVSGSINIDKTIIGVGETGNLSNYTADQKTLINQFKASRPIDRKSYYVFVFGNEIRPSRASVAGFMPLKRQFGFVFSGNLSQKEEGKSSLAGTLAHELGHGAFALQHPFKKLGTTQGGTGWLMDYGNGMRLSHIDWAQIHNPEFRLYLFQDEEDAALTFSALTPDWKPFRYSGDGVFIFSSEIENPNGAVFEIIENGKRYKWNSNSRSYVNVELPVELDISTYPDNYLDRLPSDLSLKLLWNKGNCRDNEFYVTTWGYVRDKRNLDLNNDKELHQGHIDFLLKGSCDIAERCSQLVIRELEGKINELKTISETIDNTDNVIIPELVEKINALPFCGLKELDYQNHIKKLLKRLVVTVSVTNVIGSEEAIVKLMQFIENDENTDFYKTVLLLDNERILNNLLQKMTNTSFSGFLEGGGEIDFITSLVNIVSKVKDDNSKWKVFNSIVSQKYERLEGTIQIALQSLLTSLQEYNNEQKAKIPNTLTLFIDMLKDSNLTEVRSKLNEYKLVFDIAAVKNDYRELFRSFTIADFLILIRNPNNPLEYADSVEPTTPLPISNARFSWVLPSLENMSYSLEQELKTGIYVLEENYLYNNSAWYRYTIAENLNKRILNDKPNEFLTIFYEQLLYYLRIGQESNSEFWNRIVSVNCDNVDDVIRHVNLNENAQSLERVSQETRFSFLKSFISCDYTTRVDDRSNELEDTDNSFMKVLSSFSPEDANILRKIEGIGFGRIQDKLGAERFNEFIVWVSMQITTSESGKAIGPLKPINGVSPKDDNYRFQLLQLEANILEFQNFSGNLQANQISVGGKRIDYDQFVMVHVKGSFTFLGERLNRGDLLVIPMIQAYAMSENNQRTVVWNSAFLAADIVSVAIPILGGGYKIFRMAGHGVAKAIMASDIVASSVSAVVTALNEDAISADLRFKIQMASLMTSIPSLFNRLPSTELKSFKNRTDNALINLNANRGINTPTLNLLRSLYNSSGNLTRIPGVPDGLVDAFKVDFPNINSVDELDDDFFNAWVTYRRNTNNLTGRLCE